MFSGKDTDFIPLKIILFRFWWFLFHYFITKLTQNYLHLLSAHLGDRHPESPTCFPHLEISALFQFNPGWRFIFSLDLSHCFLNAITSSFLGYWCFRLLRKNTELINFMIAHKSVNVFDLLHAELRASIQNLKVWQKI